MASPSGVRVALGVSSSDTAPLNILRPQPPGRSKRSSLTPSPRASPGSRASPSPRASPSSQTRSQPRAPLTRHDGLLGGLRERTEDELARASREALQEALRIEWADREAFLSRAEESRTAQLDLSARLHDLDKANSLLQTRYNDAFNDQAGLEGELEAATDLIDRLRLRMADAERQTREGHKRYADQERAFEAERQVLLAEQQHLQQRVKSLSTAARKSRAAEVEPHTAVDDELASLTASHSTLVAQLGTLADELHEVRADNARLREENDSWQLLVEERTLTGTIRDGHGLFFNPTDEMEATSPAPSRRSRMGELQTLDEQLEMDELHSELVDHDHAFALDMEDHTSSSLKRDILSRSAELASSPASTMHVRGLNLAAELGLADEATQGELEVLRTEVKNLKDANKSLTLYCSKILDRIIAQEGFEHILSVDYKTRRGVRSTSRPNVQDLSQAMSDGNSEISAAAATTRLGPRPGSASTLLRTSSIATGNQPEAVLQKDDKEKEKRARRGFSIDFRSLGFGSASTPIPAAAIVPEPNPALKPLTLGNRIPGSPQKLQSSAPPQPATSIATTAIVTLVSPAGSPPIIARKLEQHEEDEEDRRERHRMEATLKLMGIERPESPAATLVSSIEARTTTTATLSPIATVSSPAVTPTSGATSWFSRRLSRLPPATVETPSPIPSSLPVGNTPLSRLSAALGDTSPLYPHVELADPLIGASEADDVMAVAALRAFDAREREQARLISGGKSPSSYTSPGRIASRRGQSKRESGGGTGGAAFITPERSQNIVKSESISTIWSLGSSRASADLGMAADAHAASVESVLGLSEELVGERRRDDEID